MSVGTNITKLERVKRASSWGGSVIMYEGKACLAKCLFVSQ